MKEAASRQNPPNLTCAASGDRWRLMPGVDRHYEELRGLGGGDRRIGPKGDEYIAGFRPL